MAQDGPARANKIEPLYDGTKAKEAAVRRPSTSMKEAQASEHERRDSHKDAVENQSQFARTLIRVVALLSRLLRFRFAHSQSAIGR